MAEHRLVSALCKEATVRQYLDFDLAIEPTSEAEYVARVLRSPAGEAESTFEWPFSPQDLEILILRIGHTRRGTRRSDSPEMRQARDFGRTLFETVFSGPARTCLIRSIDEAERQDAGLRIRLRLGSSPQLNDVPWEYLYSDDLNRFLIVSTETPIVRYIDLQRRVRPVTVTLPLHILAVVSAPSDLPQLDVEGEWERLQQALAPLDQQVALERLEAPTLEKLQQRLRRDEVHILHFIGHGAFNPGSDEGVLFFTNERGGSHTVTGEDLGTVLHDHRALRLVVLNSCEGARSDPADPFSGSATALVGQGIPAVIAMQFEITDRAALTIAKNFYGSLADGYAVDAALAEARKAIFSQGNDVEWGTPVLYMRSQNGRLFDIDTSVVPAPPTDESASARAAMLNQAKSAASNAEWGHAISTLEELVEERPDDDEAQGLLEEARIHHLAANLYRGAGFLAAAEQWDAVLERFRDIDALGVAIDDGEDLRAQAVNAVEARRMAERLTEQLENARAGLAEADWARAQYNAEAVLAEHPDHDEAQRIAAEAKNRATVAELYSLAAGAADAEQWDQVLKRFEEIDATGVAYLEDEDDLRQRATAQIAEQARLRDLASRYEGALALMEAEDWDQALSIIDSIAVDEPGYRGIEQLRERVAAELDEARHAAEQAAAERHYVDAIRAAAIDDWQAVTAALDRVAEIAPGFGDPENLREQAWANSAELSDRTEPSSLEQTLSDGLDAADRYESADRDVSVLDVSKTPPPDVSGLDEVDVERSAANRSPPPSTTVWWRKLPAWLPGALIILSADLAWNLEWWGDQPGRIPVGVLIGRVDVSLGGLPFRPVLLALGTIVALQPYRYPERPLIRRVAAGLTVVSVIAIALSAGLSSDISLGPLATSIGPWLAVAAATAMVRVRLPSLIKTPITDGPLAPGTGSLAVVAIGSAGVLIAAWLPWLQLVGDRFTNGFDYGLTANLSLGTALTLTGLVALVAALIAVLRQRPYPTWLSVVGVAVFVYASSFQMFWLSDPFFRYEPANVSAAAWVAAFAGILLAVGHRLSRRAGTATAFLFLFSFLAWSQTARFARELWSNADSDRELLVVGTAGLSAAILVSAALIAADRQVRRVPRSAPWGRNATTILVIGLAGFALFAYGENRMGRLGGDWASVAGSTLTLLVTSGLALSWTRGAKPSRDRPT